jgi:hypothetical protein
MCAQAQSGRNETNPTKPFRHLFRKLQQFSVGTQTESGRNETHPSVGAEAGGEEWACVV